jgi:hypothetical protein
MFPGDPPDHRFLITEFIPELFYLPNLGSDCQKKAIPNSLYLLNYLELLPLGMVPEILGERGVQHPFHPKFPEFFW